MSIQPEISFLLPMHCTSRAQRRSCPETAHKDRLLSQEFPGIGRSYYSSDLLRQILLRISMLLLAQMIHQPWGYLQRAGRLISVTEQAV